MPISPATLQSLVGAYNVRSYGATGNGTTDDTAAIQSALNAAGNAGTICYAPPGNYLIAGSLTIPGGVQFLGSWVSAPQFVGAPVGGTQLWITGGAGNASGTPTISIGGTGPSTMAGFALYWPNQLSSQTTPTAYPWAVQMNITGTQSSANIRDCSFVNPYQGILVGPNMGRATVERIYGQPIATGVYVEASGDICRLYDLHLVYLWAQPGTNAQTWIQANGTAFEFGRSDEQYCRGLFAIGYNIGYQFINNTYGSTYGEFVGCGIDGSTTGINCQSTGRAGVRFTGGNIYGGSVAGNPFLTQSGGNLAFAGTGFVQGGSTNGNALTQTGGDLMLTGCTFRDPVAVAMAGTSSVMNGCRFDTASGTSIALSGTGKATVTGNTLEGAAFSSILSGTASGGTVTSGNN